MLFLIVLIPVAIACIAKFALKFDICWKEFALQIVAGVVAVSLIWCIGFFSKAGDQEILNGAVTGKNVAYERCYTNMVARVCRNSYDCNCYTVCTPTTDSKGNVTGQSCTTYCDTCYRYPWEKNYDVQTSIGNYTISRVDDQGRNMPARFSRVQVGDPAARTHNYQNWVKAASNSLFRDSAAAAERYEGRLPTYPIRIYDYYNVDRFVQVGTRLSNARQWNAQISRANSVLGPRKQMNLIIVVANNVDTDYAYALRYHWTGLKKNDAVVFIGTRNNVVSWVEVLSWSKNPAYEVRTREYLTQFNGLPVTSIQPAAFTEQLKQIGLANFERRPMKDFEYLRGDITPPTWLIWLSIIFSVILGVGLSILFHKNEVFYNQTQSTFRRF